MFGCGFSGLVAEDLGFALHYGGLNLIDPLRNNSSSVTAL